MAEAKGNVVIAGDKVYAGIDEDDCSECTNALVIEFKDVADMRAATHTANDLITRRALRGRR